MFLDNGRKLEHLEEIHMISVKYPVYSSSKTLQVTHFMISDSIRFNIFIKNANVKIYK